MYEYRSVCECENKYECHFFLSFFLVSASVSIYGWMWKHVSMSMSVNKCEYVDASVLVSTFV